MVMHRGGSYYTWVPGGNGHAGIQFDLHIGLKEA